MHASLPVRTVAELIAHARANPGQVLFASPGTGAVSHLALELFRARTGVDIVHVPYRGGAPAALDLRAGRVHAMFQAPQEAALVLRDGASRGLGVTVAERIPGYPDLPPVADTLPGFEVTFWQGLFAPVGMPAEVIARVGTALRAATDDAALRSRMAEQGVQITTGDAAMLRAALEADTRKWGDVIRAGNIRLE